MLALHVDPGSNQGKKEVLQKDEGRDSFLKKKDLKTETYSSGGGEGRNILCRCGRGEKMAFFMNCISC